MAPTLLDGTALKYQDVGICWVGDGRKPLGFPSGADYFLMIHMEKIQLMTLIELPILAQIDGSFTSSSFKCNSMHFALISCVEAHMIVLFCVPWQLTKKYGVQWSGILFSRMD